MPQSRPLTPGLIRFGIFEADLQAGELRKNGVKIKLEGQPLYILTLLLERPGQLITREEIKQKLWPADTFVDFDHSINVAVQRLREALDDSAETPRYIETLPRRGYRFIYPINGHAAATAQPAALPRFGWHVKTLLIAFPVVLIAIVALNVGGLRDRIFGIAPGTIDSVLVSPAKNYTGDPSQEFVADGLTDSLTTHLAQVGALRVPSVTSAMFYKAERKKLPEIAKELKVDAVIEPSVQRSGTGLLINIQLIYAPTDRHLWAKQYESSGQDLQAVLSRIARDVVEAMKVTLKPEERSRLARPKETSPQAYEAFLKGRYLLKKGTEANRKKAAEHFNQAIRIDPNFALPYAGLAVLYSHGGAALAGGPLETRAKAREWAKKALELDGTSAEAYTALASVDQADWDWRGADHNFMRAIELNPNYTTARSWYAQFLSGLRRFEEAQRQTQFVLELDPLSPDLVTHAVVPYWQAGRIDEAMAQWRKVIELEPNYRWAHHFLGRGYLAKGMYAEAIEEFQKSIALGERSPIDLGLLVNAYARAGQREAARKVVRELEGRGKGKPPPLALAFAYLGLGEKDKVFAALEAVYERHGSGLFFLNSDPLWEPLRSDPRFIDLVRRVGLPPSPTSARN